MEIQYNSEITSTNNNNNSDIDDEPQTNPFLTKQPKHNKTKSLNRFL